MKAIISAALFVSAALIANQTLAIESYRRIEPSDIQRSARGDLLEIQMVCGFDGSDRDVKCIHPADAGMAFTTVSNADGERFFFENCDLSKEGMRPDKCLFLVQFAYAGSVTQPGGWRQIAPVNNQAKLISLGARAMEHYQSSPSAEPDPH